MQSIPYADFAITGWHGIAGGLTSPADWQRWACHERAIEPRLPRPALTAIPSRMARRLDTIGCCVMAACEQCLPLLATEPAVICTSRHGDLPAMHTLLQGLRAREDISPTAFAYSVHNRFSSLISMFAGYHGINGAYSSVRDGFALALAEATICLSAHPERPVLVVAYESEIPPDYQLLIAQPWSPYVAAFVLTAATAAAPRHTLRRHPKAAEAVAEAGSCLPFIRAWLTTTQARDGFWEYQYHD